MFPPLVYYPYDYSVVAPSTSAIYEHQLYSSTGRTIGTKLSHYPSLFVGFELGRQLGAGGLIHVPSPGFL